MRITNLTEKHFKSSKQSLVSDHSLEFNCSIDFDHFDILALDANKFRLLIKECLFRVTIKHGVPHWCTYWCACKRIHTGTNYYKRIKNRYLSLKCEKMTKMYQKLQISRNEG